MRIGVTVPLGGARNVHNVRTVRSRELLCERTYIADNAGHVARHLTRFETIHASENASHQPSRRRKLPALSAPACLVWIRSFDRKRQRCALGMRARCKETGPSLGAHGKGELERTLRPKDWDQPIISSATVASCFKELAAAGHPRDRQRQPEPGETLFEFYRGRSTRGFITQRFDPRFDVSRPSCELATQWAKAES